MSEVAADERKSSENNFSTPRVSRSVPFRFVHRWPVSLYPSTLLNSFETLDTILDAKVFRDLASKTAKEVQASGSDLSEKMSGLSQVLKSFTEDVRDCHTSLSSIREDISAERRRDILHWLSSSADPSRNYNRAINSREPNTGEWFLESDEFIRWMNDPGCMWLHGIRESPFESFLTDGNICHGVRLHCYTHLNCVDR